MTTNPDRTSERLRAIALPAHTAVVTVELQRGIVSDEAVLPDLPIAVRNAGVLQVAGRVCRAARQHQVRVLHATFEEHPGGAGQIVNCRLAAIGAKRRAEVGYSPTELGQPGVALVDELEVSDADLRVPRSHGMTPFNGTELDSILRSLGITTVVLLGVSLNVAVLGAAISAVDLGYQVIVVRDAVVGLPPEYGAAVLEHTLSMLATVVDSDALLGVWDAGGS